MADLADGGVVSDGDTVADGGAASDGAPRRPPLPPALLHGDLFLDNVLVEGWDEDVLVEGWDEGRIEVPTLRTAQGPAGTRHVYLYLI